MSNKISINSDVGVSFVQSASRNIIFSGPSIKEAGGGTQIINEDITITANGIYTASEGYTGIGKATVALPLGPVTITTNKTVSASSLGLQGFDTVVVNVPNPSTGTLNITSNGTYNVTQYASAYVNCQTADIVTATNNTGSNIALGDKVWLEKVSGGWSIILFANISSTSLSGFAESAIADGASGEVKTVLPEQVTITITVDANNADISAV